MKTIQLTQAQLEAAEALQEGPVAYAYLDDQEVRMETEEGNDPYVWRRGTWVSMVDGRY